MPATDNEKCVKSGLPRVRKRRRPFTGDRAVTAGDGFYYLVRAENACGSGTHGPGRDGLDLAPPCP